MKPIKLEIEGLHSFEAKQVIDFKALSSKNIFGIFGQTGSGKSTILDAIVLSLYGKVQRSKTNSDFINTKSKKCVISFDFLFNCDGEQKEFIVTRTFKRKKDGGVDQSAEIFESGAFGTRQVMEGANKVDKFIVELLGISETEFLKCVALPQGEFAAFLKAKPNERISIIGNIFNLNKYGDELWEKVKTRCENLETQKSVLEGQLLVLGEVDEIQLNSLKEKLEDKNKELQKTVEELALLSKTEKEESEVVELSTELNEVNKKIAECEEISTSIEFKKSALFKAKKLNENKFVLDRERELTKEILKENNEIYKLNETIQAEKLRLEAYEAESEQELEQLKIEIGDSIRKLENVKAVIPVQKELVTLKKDYEDLKVEKNITEKKIETLTRKLSNKKLDKAILNSKIVDTNSEIERIKEDLAGFDSLIGYSSLSKFTEELKSYHRYAENKHSDAVLLLSTAISCVDKAKKEEDEITEKIKAIQLKYVPKSSGKEPIMVEQRSKLYESHLKFIEFKTRIEEIERNNIKLIKKLDEREKEKEQKQEEKLELDEKYKELYEDILLLRASLDELLEEKNRALSENGLSNVIRKVKIGDSCPICRSEVLEKNSPENIDFVVLDNDITALRKNIEIKEEKKESLLYKTARVMSAIEDLSRQIEEINNEIESSNLLVSELFEKYLNIAVPNTKEKLDEVENEFALKKEQVVSDYKKERLLFDKLVALRENTVKNNVINLVAKEQAVMFSELMNSIAESINQKDVEMLGILSSGEDFAVKLEQMKEVNSKLEEKLKLKDELNSKLLSIGDEILVFETELAVLLEQKKSNLDNIQRTAETIKEKENMVSSVVSGDATETASIIEKDIENKKHRENQIAVLKQERVQNLSELKNNLTEIVVLNKTHTDEHKLVAGEVQSLINTLELNSLEEAKPFIIEDVEMISLENSIVQYETKYKHYLKRREELELKLDGRISGNAILEQLSIQVVEVKNKVDALKGEMITLNYDIKAKDEKLSKIKELSISLNGINEKYNAAKELYTAIKGKALLEYIAEEFIDDISFMASNKLQILMDGRYELKYENREFIVIDNFNDGSVRPVATLSGGEMFVVSLALALSISDAIVSKSNKTIDFFFLDEGFGTLDKEYCEYVVDSLIKLTSTNLTVGLISHIPELQERISEKVYITKTSSGSVIKNISSI